MNQLFHHSTLRGFKCPFCKMEYVSRYPKSLLLHLASSHKVNEKMGSLQAFILKFGITDNPEGAGKFVRGIMRSLYLYGSVSKTFAIM